MRAALWRGLGLHLDRQDPNLLPRYARAFDLGAPTGIRDIPEEPGLVPDPAYKLSTSSSPWWSGDAVNLAIGQGDLLVTPLQVARLLAAVANGGTLYRPQLIHHIVSPSGPLTLEFKPEVAGQLPVSAANLTTIQDGLRGMANKPKGTARRRFLGLSIPVAGKTGTAQAPGADALPYAWFAGYTQAKRPDKPDIAMAVLLENAGEGSAIAAPIFRRVVEECFWGQAVSAYPWESAIGVPAAPTETLTPVP